MKDLITYNSHSKFNIIVILLIGWISFGEGGVHLIYLKLDVQVKGMEEFWAQLDMGGGTGVVSSLKNWKTFMDIWVSSPSCPLKVSS